MPTRAGRRRSRRPARRGECSELAVFTPDRRCAVACYKSPVVPGVYRYQRIDVFTDRPFHGNPLAVFTDAQGLDAEMMQRIAREMHLSETTFVFPAGDNSFDYRVRIFSPVRELSSAGSPSLGTVFALAREAQLRDRARVVLDEKDGAVSVTLAASMITVKQPLPVLERPAGEADGLAAMLSLSRADLLPGAPPQVVECGVKFTLVPLFSKSALRRIELRPDIWRRTIGSSDSRTVVAFTHDVSPPYVARARVFAPAVGIDEDPATPSACGAIAAYLVAHGLVPAGLMRQAVMAQGVEMGRASDVHVMLDCEGRAPKSLRIGGTCVWMGQGEIHVFPDDPPPSSQG